MSESEKQRADHTAKMALRFALHKVILQLRPVALSPYILIEKVMVFCMFVLMLYIPGSTIFRSYWDDFMSS